MRATPASLKLRRRPAASPTAMAEQSLGGRRGSRRVIKDRLGHIVEDVQSIRAAQDGVDLTLSIDSKIQSLAFAALKSAVERHRAKAGALVALDVQSGEVLALANV